MIKRNVIKFGYGDVATDAQMYKLKFRQFVPAQKLGTYVDADDVEWVGEKITIPIHAHDYHLLMKELDKCTYGRAFEFGGYIFDFLKFDPVSVEVVKEAVERAMFLHFLSLAA